MLNQKEYATVRKAIKDVVEISIDFYDVPVEQRRQIEDAASEFLKLAEKILTKN